MYIYEIKSNGTFSNAFTRTALDLSESLLLHVFNNALFKYNKKHRIKLKKNWKTINKKVYWPFL